MRQKLYRARQYDGVWIVETGHDFEKYPAHVRYVYPYEIEVDTDGRATRVRQRNTNYLGSAKVYREIYTTTRKQQQQVQDGLILLEVLTEKLRIAFAKEENRKPIHNSTRHYPGAVISIEDPTSGESYHVSNRQRIFVQNRSGATLRIIKVMSTIDLQTLVGAPVIRHLALRDDKLVVTVGKHTEVVCDRNTGKVISVESD